MRKKVPLQQLLIYAPKIYKLGKSSPVARNFARSHSHADTAFPCVSVGQSKDGMVWERIRSRKWFLMQMYEREEIYKSGYDNLEKV